MVSMLASSADIRRLQRDFANLNSESPFSPSNIEVIPEENVSIRSLERLDGKPRRFSTMTQADARCDPRAIPQTGHFPYHCLGKLVHNL
jgi:hypothetical protein